MNESTSGAFEQRTTRTNDGHSTDGDPQHQVQGQDHGGRFSKLRKLFRLEKNVTGGAAAAPKEGTRGAEVEMSDVSAGGTLLTSGYLEPRSGTSFGTESGGFHGSTEARSTTASPGGAAPHRMTPLLTTVNGGDEVYEMDEREREMKEMEAKISHARICESVLVTAVLVVAFVVGIVITSLSSLGLVYKIIGPTMLGLSAFALIGKTYVTVFWEENPFLWTKKRLLRIRSAAAAAAATSSSTS